MKKEKNQKVTKKKHSCGKKREGETLTRPRTISLNDEQVAIAKHLGKGNLSKGLKMALNFWKENN